LPTPCWDNRPELYEDLIEVWEAFQDLSACRTCGFGPNPIAWDQMYAWLRVHEVNDVEVRKDFCRLIMAMDRVFLEHASKDAESGDRGKPGTGDRPR